MDEPIPKELIEDKLGKTASDEELIRIRKERIIKLFKKDSFFSTLFICAAASLLFSLLTKIGFNYVVGVFEPMVWFILAICFGLSALAVYSRKQNLFPYPLLAFVVYLSVKIRTSNLAGLKDVTTGDWTLGPDLDPFLFLRWAKYIVEHGTLMAVDTMRYVPFGMHTSEEYLLHPYMMAWFHKIAIYFGSVSVTESAVLYPAIMFGLTVIAFFLMTRRIFLDTFDKKLASLIALIASFFLSVLPALLPRTIAGIPEKESVAFLFMFLAFYFFLSAWKSKKSIWGVILALLSGISTAAMAHIWGGYIYIFYVIGPFVLVAFLIEKVDKKEFYVYTAWVISALFTMYFFFGKYSLIGLFKSPSTSFSIFMLFVILMDRFILKISWVNEKLSFTFLRKIPPKAVSVLISIILVIILSSLLLGPSAIYSQVTSVKDALVQSTSSRLIQTVAENRQPEFKEWENSFGPHIYGFAITFWLFFAGSIVLFYSTLKSLHKNQRILFTLAYVFFLFALIFSKYSSSTLLNGTNPTSLFIYAMGFVVLFFFVGKKGFESVTNKNTYNFVYAGLTASLFALFFIGGEIITVVTTVFATVAGVFALIGATNQKEFREVRFEVLFLLLLFFLGLVSTRAGVRFVMVLVPSASILAAYLIVKTYSEVRVTKDRNRRSVLIVIFAVILLASVFSAAVFYSSVNSEAANYVPSIYTQQWQKAMNWVRENTSETAVFGHWWDYGYWLQSIGERATVLDGGNMISYWNHMMGRYALTGTNETEALEFLYAHNTTHFLIDSTDIGKYSAFSTIGSDKDYDRASYLPAFTRDSSQIQEKKNSTIFVYTGGASLDEDIIYEQNGTRIFLPAGNAGLGAVLIEKSPAGKIVGQPQGIFVYQGKQYNLPFRYAFDGKLIDFGKGIESGIFLMPSIAQQSSGSVQIEPDGALIYLSKRTVNSQLARLYLYQEADPYFKLVHSEDDFVIAQIRSQNPDFSSDIIYYQGIRGPIRIWEINYPQGILVKEQYLSTKYPEDIFYAR